MPRLRLRLGLACLSLSFLATAQTISAPPAPERIRAATLAAGIIFRGTVISVARILPNHANQVDTVEIQFHVDEGLRGAKTGSTLRIREWTGLWTSHDRYRVGERVALFLYPPSRLGLTSPVGGDLGRFPVDDSGKIVLEPEPTQRALSPVNAPRPVPPRTVTPRELRQFVRRGTEN